MCFFYKFCRSCSLVAKSNHIVNSLPTYMHMCGCLPFSCFYNKNVSKKTPKKLPLKIPEFYSTSLYLTHISYSSPWKWLLYYLLKFIVRMYNSVFWKLDLNHMFHYLWINFIFICSKYNDIRSKYQLNYPWPSVIKFISIMKSTRRIHQLKIAKHLKESFNRRNLFIEHLNI